MRIVGAKWCMVLGVVAAALVGTGAHAQTLPQTEEQMRTLAQQVSARLTGQPALVRVMSVPTHGVYNVVSMWWLDEHLVQIGAAGLTPMEQRLWRDEPASLMAKMYADQTNRLPQGCSAHDATAPKVLKKIGRQRMPDQAFSLSCVRRADGLRTITNVVNILRDDGVQFFVTVMQFGAASQAQINRLDQVSGQTHRAIREIWGNRQAGPPVISARQSQAWIEGLTGQILSGAYLVGEIAPSNSFDNRFAAEFYAELPSGMPVMGSLEASQPTVIDDLDAMLKDAEKNAREQCPGQFNSTIQTVPQKPAPFDTLVFIDSVCQVREGVTHFRAVVGMVGLFVYSLDFAMALERPVSPSQTNQVSSVKQALADSFLRIVPAALR